MVFAVTLIAVFALQIIAYRVITRKLAERRQMRHRLSSLVYHQPKARTAPQLYRNRLGED